MLSCYKNIKLFTLSLISCAVLVGCNTDNKDSYKGPVQGTAKVEKAAGTVTFTESKKIQATKISNPTSPETSPSIFGEGQRFLSQSADVTETPLYTYSPAYEYDFGGLVVNGKPDYKNKGQPAQTAIAAVNIIRMHGWIRYPQITTKDQNKKFPIILLFHGNHDAADPSYKGYDYLATNLAEQGYVVLSINANEINAFSNGINPNKGDRSSQSRAQLLLGTLDKLAQLDEFGGAGALTVLKDKLDFNRIGLMGHSRGGQGVHLAIKFNTARFGNDISILKKAILANPTHFSKYPEFIELTKLEKDDTLLTALNQHNINFAKTTDSIQPYNFKAAVTLGSTDYEQIKGITNVPTATLLPSCDGDIEDLHAAMTFDNNRFSLQHDSAAKYQILVRGANHNFYNHIWDVDDSDYNEDERKKAIYCSASRTDSIRQTADEQRNMGRFLINSFLRFYVGDEQQFKNYWNGAAQLPSSVCAKDDKTCDERVLLTVQKQDSKIIQRFESSNATAINLLGGFNRFEGFNLNGIIACKSFLGFKDADRISKCSSITVPFYGDLNKQRYDSGVVSFADQLHLSWSQPYSSYLLNLNQLATQGYDSLTFRIALPQDIAQEIYVELTDLEGKTARVTASDFTDALFIIPRKKQNGIAPQVLAEDEKYKGTTSEALNMISIPLKAFKGIKTNYLKELKFIFPKEKGGIAMNDIQLQKLRS